MAGHSFRRPSSALAVVASRASTRCIMLAVLPRPFRVVNQSRCQHSIERCHATWVLSRPRCNCGEIMATIEKRIGKDGVTSYRAKVRVKGFTPESATFARLTDGQVAYRPSRSAGLL